VTWVKVKGRGVQEGGGQGSTIRTKGGDENRDYPVVTGEWQT